MNYSLIQYLLESSIALLFFLIIYRLLIANLTHFRWMRGYLLLSLVLSIILPLISIPSYLSLPNPVASTLENQFSTELFNQDFKISQIFTNTTPASGQETNIIAILAIIFISIYFIGVLNKTVALGWNLLKIRNYIAQNEKHKEGKYWIVKLGGELPAFSFLHYIFINSEYRNLSGEELEKIRKHELIHVSQYHTIDTMFAELSSILLWINPAMKYLKKSLQEVHEFLADEQLTTDVEVKKNYANLLLALTTDARTFTLSSGFSGKQIGRRVFMLSKARSLPGYKILIALLIPISFIVLLSCSFFDRDSATLSTTVPPSGKSESGFNSEVVDSAKIGSIYWENNELYSDSELTKALGFKSGDIYTTEKIYKRMFHDQDCFAGLYMDIGYVFYTYELMEEPKEGGIVDLRIKIYEGMRAKIGDITINGNSEITDTEIINMITVKPGELFNRKKFIESVKILEASNKFVPGSIVPTPVPNPSKATADFAVVDIVFEVAEKD